MCDEYGIYIYDEANIESHGMYYTRYPDDMRKGAVGHIDGRKNVVLWDTIPIIWKAICLV